MTQLTIKVSAGLVRQGLEDLGAEIPLIGRRRIRTTLNRIQRRLQKPGKKPTYPIQWDSEKQRRAFFATDGFGHGIPYKRSGDYENAWTITSLPDGYQLSNATAYAKYVGGDAYGVVHSGIHSGRWEVYRDVVDEEIKTLPEEVKDEIIMVARRNGL